MFEFHGGDKVQSTNEGKRTCVRVFQDTVGNCQAWLKLSQSGSGNLGTPKDADLEAIVDVEAIV